jgi:hypothetical protein
MFKKKENIINKPINKHKNIILVCIFLVVFKLIDLGIGEILCYYKYFNQPDMHSLAWDDFYNSKKNSIDVMFLGSSHARFAFDTKVFDKSLSVKTFNLSSSGQTPVVGYYALKEALKYQKPKVLIYETYWRIIGTNDNITPAYFVYDYIKGYDTKFEILLNTHNEKNFSSFLMQALSKTYKYREAFMPAVKNILKGNIIKSMTVANNVKYADFTYYGEGFFGSNVVASNEKLYKTNSFRNVGPNFELDNKQMEYFKKTIELCQKNNIKVLMVTAPLPTPSMEYIKDYYKYHNSFMKIANSFGIQYIDYNQENIELNKFKNELFYDSNHLNMKGTEVIDALLLPIIKNYLN